MWRVAVLATSRCVRRSARDAVAVAAWILPMLPGLKAKVLIAREAIAVSRLRTRKSNAAHMGLPLRRAA